MAEKFDYSKSRQTAERLIERFGAELPFTREVSGAYNPVTGQTSNTQESFTSNVVWLNYEKDEIDETNVFRGDAKLLCDGDVQPDDEVTFQGSVWRVVDTRTINPTGSDRVMTIAQARR